MAGQFCSSLHPLTPPLEVEERLSWLRLIRSRKVGVATFFRLMAEHGTAKNALAALPEIAADAGVSKYETFSESAAKSEVRAARLAGAKMVCYGETNYPSLLKDIPDPPPILWTKGNLNALTKPTVAIVGARNASSLGTRLSRRLANELSEVGYVVVSGLARGIDAAAHLGALDSGTVGVLAGGVDILYPAENAELARNIETAGVRISEGPMGLQPRARHFPKRNRIISGMSRAIIVVEAAAQSGSLITAKNALDQGRDVLAIPGHPFDGRAAGGNMLIRDGATLVRNAADVIEAIGSIQTPDHQSVDKQLVDLQPKPKTNRSLREIAALHQQILERLSPSPIAEDQLIRDLGARAETVSPELFSLEVDGKIQRAPGGLLSLVPRSAD